MKLKNVRLAFTSVFEPTAFRQGKAKFKTTVIIEKDDPQLEAVKERIRSIVTEKWGSNPPPQLELCLRDGTEKGHIDGFGPWVMFFNASSDKRPAVVDRDRTPLTEQDGKIYSGVRATVIVDFWAQDNEYGKRLNASLQGVQFYEYDEPFSGSRVASADDFDDYENDVDASAAAAHTGGTVQADDPLFG